MCRSTLPIARTHSRPAAGIGGVYSLPPVCGGVLGQHNPTVHYFRVDLQQTRALSASAALSRRPQNNKRLGQWVEEEKSRR